MTGSQLDHEPPITQLVRPDLDDAWLSLQQPDDAGGDPSIEQEFAASGIDDRSIAELLRRLATASAALRGRVDVARQELRDAEAEAAASRDQNDEAAKSLRHLTDLCHDTEQQARETVAPARAEAEELRSRARALLADARAEVA